MCVCGGGGFSTEIYTELVSLSVLQFELPKLKHTRTHTPQSHWGRKSESNKRKHAVVRCIGMRSIEAQQSPNTNQEKENCVATICPFKIVRDDLLHTLLQTNFETNPGSDQECKEIFKKASKIKRATPENKAPAAERRFQKQVS